MTTEKILYTDGHKVTVTESFFKVKKSLYQLDGITHGFFIVHPDRFFPFIVSLIGGIMSTLGGLRQIPDFMPAVTVFSVQLDASGVILGLGIGIFISGALRLLLMRDRYAVRIATGEGERNVIVSRKREYINQILDALNHASLNHLSSSRKQSPVGQENGRHVGP